MFASGLTIKWVEIGAVEKLRKSAEASRFVYRRKPAFAFEYEGRWHAYLNACPHLGVELDWEPGQVFDPQRKHLLCSTHGAMFEPATGLCINGLCKGQSLQKLEVKVERGVVYCALRSA